RDDISALWNYGAALIAFKQQRTEDADRLLKRAIEQNLYVPKLLKDPEQIPPVSPDSWSPGTPSEAVMVAQLLGEAWESDEAALAWLVSATKDKPRSRPVKKQKKQTRK